jgi:LacI family transcriptional regulator
MARKTVSIRDLASELSVSASTVSRALKDHPDISIELKTRVHNLAKKWNYISASISNEQKSSATKTIGVIVPNMEKSFYASIISGIENYAKKEGYFIIIANSRENYETEIECINNLLKLKVDGLIVCLTQDTHSFTHFDTVLHKNIPLVFFDRVCRTNEFSSVVADNSDAAKELTLHLFKSGAKKVAHIAGPKKLYITKERIAGYFRGLEECHAKYKDEYLVHCDLTPEGALKAIKQLLNYEQIPDAIFCVNDTAAYVAMKEIKRQGYRVPEDIALTGFNNEFHSTIVEPTLTSMLHPTSELGEETARLLLGQIASEHKPAPRQIVMKTKLVVRESSVKNN